MHVALPLHHALLIRDIFDRRRLGVGHAAVEDRRCPQVGVHVVEDGVAVRTMIFWPTTAAATRCRYMQSCWSISTPCAGVGSPAPPFLMFTPTLATLPS